MACPGLYPLLALTTSTASRTLDRANRTPPRFVRKTNHLYLEKIENHICQCYGNAAKHMHFGALLNLKGPTWTVKFSALQKSWGVVDIFWNVISGIYYNNKKTKTKTSYFGLLWFWLSGCCIVVQRSVLRLAAITCLVYQLNCLTSNGNPKKKDIVKDGWLAKSIGHKQKYINIRAEWTREHLFDDITALVVTKVQTTTAPACEIILLIKLSLMSSYWLSWSSL